MGLNGFAPVMIFFEWVCSGFLSMAWVSNRRRGLVDRQRGSVAWPGFLIGGSVFEWVCVCVCGLALLLGCVCVWLCCWVNVCVCVCGCGDGIGV